MLHIPENTVIFFLFYSTVANAVDQVSQLSGIDTIPESCQNSSSETKYVTIRVGWPLKIDCKKQIDRHMYQYYYDSQSLLAHKCLITVEGEVVLEENITSSTDDYFFGSFISSSHLVPSVSSNMNGTTFSSYLIGDGICEKISYKLIVDELQNVETCSSAKFSIEMNNQISEGNLFIIPCLAEKSAFHLQQETYEVKWYKNCKEIKRIEKTGGRNDGNHIQVDSLQIVNADFNTSGGDYVCSITYNSYEMFQSKVKLCIKYQFPIAPRYSPISSPKVKSKIGEDATLICGGQAGRISSLSYVVQWIRNWTNGTEEIVCSSRLSPIDSLSTDTKYHCNLKSNVREASKCYTRSEEADEDPYKGAVTANSTLTIRNYDDNDSGRYICRVVTTMEPVQVHFEIVTQKQNYLIILLPAVLGFVLFIIICAILISCLRTGVIKKQWQKSLGRSNIESSKRAYDNPVQVTDSERKGELPTKIV